MLIVAAVATSGAQRSEFLGFGVIEQIGQLYDDDSHDSADLLEPGSNSHRRPCEREDDETARPGRGAEWGVPEFRNLAARVILKFGLQQVLGGTGGQFQPAIAASSPGEGLG
ncbi:MAG: hypothetical protein ACREJC_20365 [Tepidisphaeraceae bacterium]